MNKKHWRLTLLKFNPLTNHLLSKLKIKWNMFHLWTVGRLLVVLGSGNLRWAFFSLFFFDMFRIKISCKSKPDSIEQLIMKIMIGHRPRADDEGENEIRKGSRVHCFCLQGQLWKSLLDGSSSQFIIHLSIPNPRLVWISIICPLWLGINWICDMAVNHPLLNE